MKIYNNTGSLALDVVDMLREMASLVSVALAKSVDACLDNNQLSAWSVIGSDKAVNACEIRIDNAIYNIIATGGTSPEDMRMLMSMERVNCMLERVGDHCVNIAESSNSIYSIESSTCFQELRDMADRVCRMFEGAVKSFFDADLMLAGSIIEQDDGVDSLNISLADDVKNSVMHGKLSFEDALEIIRISRNLERIADISTNIAEDVCFAVTGRNVKHMSAENRSVELPADTGAVP